MRRELSVRNASDEALPLPPPPLVRGEDPAAYDQLAARITAAVAPANVIEEIWVRDVVDLVWDVVRLRPRRWRTPFWRRTTEKRKSRFPVNRL